jgi:hypothetical protein
VPRRFEGFASGQASSPLSCHDDLPTSGRALPFAAQRGTLHTRGDANGPILISTTISRIAAEGDQPEQFKAIFIRTDCVPSAKLRDLT